MRGKLLQVSRRARESKWGGGRGNQRRRKVEKMKKDNENCNQGEEKWRQVLEEDKPNPTRE